MYYLSLYAILLYMETQTSSRAKDFFINLGAIVALYTSIVSLLNLLFTIINTSYPQINSGYNFFGSASISWPVATIIVFFPIFLFLMWLLERDYKVNPEKQSSGIHRWLTYITLFIAGLTIAIDLITVLYYFLDGQELTTGFILKVLVLLVVAGAIFSYYLYDILGKLTGKLRMIYRVVAVLFIVISIIWGFVVLGSPRTQRLYKYDTEKVNDLMNISYGVESFYGDKGVVPQSLAEIESSTYFYGSTKDSQTGVSYEYEKTGKNTYNLCAEFNKASPDVEEPDVYARPVGYKTWAHPAGHYCFEETINPNLYSKPIKY